MILDSSAIIAIHRREPGYERLTHSVASAEFLGIGTPTMLETVMVLSGVTGIDGREMVERFLRRAEVEIIPFTVDHFEAASAAFSRYGKGRHPAALNFGDCMSYATARLADMPLLFTGNDFGKTDVDAA